MIYVSFEQRIKAIPFEKGNMSGYRTKVFAIEDEFKEALEKEYLPWETNDVHEAIWGYSWMEGHSSGLSDVENIYCRVADIIRVAVKR